MSFVRQCSRTFFSGAGRFLAVAALLLAAATSSLADPAHAATNAPARPLGELGFESPRQVALAQFNGDLYMAWIGIDANETLNIAFSTDDGLTWSAAFEPFGRGNSQSAPALAVFGGKLWMAWTGTDANHTLNLASSTNGTLFTQATQPLGRNNSDDGPALATFNGRLYYGWKGTDSNHTLNIASSADGVTFTAPIQPGRNSSINAPSLAAIGGTLYMAWAGTDSNHDVNLASSTNGTSFSQFHFGFGSRHQPSIAGNPANPILEFAFTGNDDNLHIFHYVGSPNVSTAVLATSIAQAPTVTVLADGAIVYAWIFASIGSNIALCTMKTGSNVCS